MLCIQPPFLFPIPLPLKENITNMTELAQDTDGLYHFEESYYIGAGLALSCAVCGSACNILIAKCQGVKTMTLVFYSGVMGIIVGTIGCLVQPENGRILLNIEALQPQDWILLIVISALGVLAYLTMTESLKSISPTSVSVLRALEIILAFICQISFMGQMPNLLCISGASLVILSVVGIAVEEKLKNSNH